MGVVQVVEPNLVAMTREEHESTTFYSSATKTDLGVIPNMQDMPHCQTIRGCGSNTTIDSIAKCIVVPVVFLSLSSCIASQIGSQATLIYFAIHCTHNVHTTQLEERAVTPGSLGGRVVLSRTVFPFTLNVHDDAKNFPDNLKVDR